MVQIDTRFRFRSPSSGIKCVIWDLDDTLWRGTLAEGDDVIVCDSVRETILTLDRRGILQSIASKNDFEHAWAKLVELRLDQYFLHPQISWGNKSDAVQIIAREFGIGLNACLFIDDQPFEREEVAFFHPDVRTTHPAGLTKLLGTAALRPRVVTDEGADRRNLYVADLMRKRSEERFDGTRDQYLAGLNMVMTIRRAVAKDLNRAEELTVRTNQLNTTGRTYSHEELCTLLNSPEHLILVAQLRDRFGNSGIIGLALLAKTGHVWTIRLLLMSCRVITRGVGTILISHIVQQARAEGASIRAEFVPTARNRVMYVTYKFSGFREIGVVESAIVLEHDFRRIPPFPPHVCVENEDSWR